MKTKLWSLLSLVFAAATAFAAGDIYEIIPCDRFATKVGPYATYENPIQSASADSYYFSLRLMVRNSPNGNPNAGGLKKYYQLVHTDPFTPQQFDELTDENRFGIGVFVSGKVTDSTDIVDSGRIEYANLVDIIPNANSVSNFFDCVFEYKLKPGHFALPVRLAVEDKNTETQVTTIRPASDATDNGSQYHFRNANKWAVHYVDVDAKNVTTASWAFVSSSAPLPKVKPDGSIGSSYKPAGDYSLAKVGLYVQTVDFDQTSWESEGEFWREVPMGDEIRCPVKAIAEATGVEKDTTLYVWSQDESAVKIVGGEEVEIVTNIATGVKQTTKVTIGTIQMKGGTATADFDVLGVMSNKIADVVLSSWKGFRYDINNNTRVIEYKTIPIKCGDMPVPSVEISFDGDYPKAPSSKSWSTTASTNFLDRTQDAIPLYVTLTKAPESAVSVGVTVKYEANTAIDAIAERFVSVSKSGDEFFETDMYSTNVTFAAGETQKVLYVYPLGGNGDTQSSGISFTPAILSAGATDIYEIGSPSLLKIGSRHDPVIYEPENEHNYGNVPGGAGEGFDISLFVNDCFRDMKNTNGFVVSFSGALKGQPTTNLVFTAGESLDFTVTGYNKKTEGLQKGTIKVTEPGTTRSATVQVLFTVLVEQDKLVYADLYKSTDPSSKCAGTQFSEGENLIVAFRVNQSMAPGESLYFFLKPLSEASANLVSCSAFTQGVELSGGQTNTALIASFAMSLLDGCADTELKSLEYDIIARTGPSLTDPESVLYTPAQKLIINVANVKPSVQGVKVNGASEAVENNANAVWKHAVSAQVDVPFQAIVSDPSTYFDVSNGLMTVWCFTDGRTSSQYRYEFAKITNGTEIVTVNHQFTYAGGATQDVAVVSLDKDILWQITGKTEINPTPTEMGELWSALTDKTKSYYSEPYRFRVLVGKRPSITVYFPANENRDDLRIAENAKQTDKEGRLCFELTEPADEEIEVKITVTPLNEDNPGNLELACYKFKIPAGGTEPRKSTDYNGGVNFVYDTLDGTAGSFNDGFYLRVEVTTDAEKGKDYFDYGEGWVYIDNTPPVIYPPQPAVTTTNHAVAVGEDIQFIWSVKDVLKDLNADDPAAVTYRWYDNGMEIKSAAGIVTTSDEQTTTLKLTSEGFHEVRLIATDKEGENYNGQAERYWLYFIDPVKKVSVKPYGPAGSSKSPLYRTVSGRGQGRVYADSSSYVVQDFISTWTYGVKAVSAKLFAWGYPSNAKDDGSPLAYTDDGTLDPDPSRDIPLTQYGNSWPAGTTPVSAQCYPVDGIYDNYFYRWVYLIPGGGVSNDVVQATISPLTTVDTTLQLPAYEDGKENYEMPEVEAIFSREKYTADNCGDINADGIPDLYVTAYGFDVYDEKGTEIGSDIKLLDKYNEDEDFLPKSVASTFQSMIPDVEGNWVNEFKAVDEIRGFGKHFNDANLIPENARVFGLGVKSDIRFTDPATDPYSTLEPVEWAAFKAYCEKKGWEVTDKAHWGVDAEGTYKNSWSPERPTDPTVADTDGDVITDGYEYWFWYKAHVGELDEAGNHVRMTGRRYLPMSPCEPAEISADTIEAIFDPLTPNENFATQDTDNDGLPDYIEFLLGTNPIDYDTDGDGLADGYEVYVTETDPLNLVTDDGQSEDDGWLNPDGDAMACYVAEKATAIAYEEDGLVKYYVCPKADAFTVAAGSITAVAGTPYTGWRYWGMGGDAKKPLQRFAVGAELKADGCVGKKVKGEPFEVELLFLHFTCYQTQGFDPRTGWNIPPYFKGHLLDTVPFRNLDEFMVVSFYLNAGGACPSSATFKWEDIWQTYKKDTRNKGVVPGEMPDTAIFQLWTKACTDPNNADTDGDGMPDGWELYVQAGHRNDKFVEEFTKDPEQVNLLLGPSSPHSPLQDFGLIAGTDAADPDHTDGLDFPHEFSGVECVAIYSNTCSTITLLQPEWQNKIWPTDPWNGDTDGDGIADGKECKYFVYGSNIHTKEDCTDIVAGGGLNPLSWDTDCDGLPDPWEVEFKGKYVADKPEPEDDDEEEADEDEDKEDEDLSPDDEETASDDEEDEEEEDIDAPVDYHWTGGMDGTANDAEKDWDYDGLLNWQEYMVGSMRCWRYDDTISPWTNLEGASNGYAAKYKAFTDEDWYNMLLNPSSEKFSPLFANERFDNSVYFSCATNRFERGAKNCIGGKVYGYLYMFCDGYYHDLKEQAVHGHYNRWTKGKAGSGYTVKDAYPKTYITLDPRSNDTDGDGMDDFYELFHGLNPLLGESKQTGVAGDSPRDIVHESWDASIKKEHLAWNAKCNYWCGDATTHLTREDYPLRLKDDSGFDFFQFPWLGGMGTADFDGDNLRNQQECLLANVQAAKTYLHTDPSPLWATDPDYDDSLVHRYYMLADPVFADTVKNIVVPASFEYGGKKYYFKDLPWLKYKTGKINPDNAACNRWKSLDSGWSYEVNEGYDSDHDFLGDYEEAQGKTKNCSDPQVFDDPLRRQAMWFGGKDEPGFLQTPVPIDETDSTGHNGDVRRDFLYFTVECWAKADESCLDGGHYTLVERAIVSDESGPADETMLRKNYQIGIDKNRWYARFDSTSTDADKGVEITDGPIATTNWTHVAASYDGSAFRLYVDGVLKSTLATQVMPEHGQDVITVTKYSEQNKKVIPSWKDGELNNPRLLDSILVGASAATVKGVCFDMQWEMRYQKVSPERPFIIPGTTTTIDDYDSFFKGYIDEVRVWDGARTSDDIREDVVNRTRYNLDLAAKRRQTVFASWMNGGSRAPTAMATEELPADLRYHWSFDHVAGAVKTNDVMTVPAGFSTPGNITDAKGIWARPEGWTSILLDYVDPSIQSKVYTDHSWTPWIDNTVAHLPRIDGSTLDSIYWNEHYSGGELATDAGYSMYAFRRNAEVYSWWVQARCKKQTKYYPVTTHDDLDKAHDLKKASIFNLRSARTIGSNLLPFGSAFPKRISNAEGGMWDDHGAADAWAQNGEDGTNNGLPDWWEEYARENYADIEPGESIDWDSQVEYMGTLMPAWRAYMRDLARGMLPDGTYHPEFADTGDYDNDGMYDWWEEMYGIDTGSKEDALADTDCDGLSNYQEFLIERDGLYYLNPTMARTFDGQVETDYFLQTTDAKGRLCYLGEIYADHDFMEDDSEDVNGYDRTLYDANADYDEDGWSNFAETRYAGFKMNMAARFATHYFAETEVKDFPIPVVHATLRYHGQVPEGDEPAPIYIEAYSGNDLSKKPSAKYTVTPGAVQERSLYLGEYTDRIYHGTLTPGHVQAGHDNIQLEGNFIQQNEKWTWQSGDVLTTGTYEEMYKAFSADHTIKVTAQDKEWFQLQSLVTDQAALQISVDDKTQKGYLYLDYAKAGEIDMITGDFTFDITSLEKYVMADTLVAVPQLFFRINYKSMLPTMQNNKLSVSLADPDQGKLTEGKTAFVAWMDKDGDGVFTPGVDPIGFVKDVEIGWDNVPSLEIEMTDSSMAAGKRFAYDDDVETIEIIRAYMNGAEKIGDAQVKKRIVFRRTAADVERRSVWEGDLSSNEKFGLDWANLRSDIEAMEGVSAKDITSVTYWIVSGALQPKDVTEADILDTFTVEYGTEKTQPLAVSPSDHSFGIVETARPTFKWTGSEDNTACMVQILSGGKVAWSSGLMSLPARDTSGNYVYEAPVYVGTNVCGETWALNNGTNYQWRVAMYNAKFSATNDAQEVSAWSNPANFRTRLATENDKSTIYGSADVEVKYFGPATNGLDRVIAQLYRNADFMGKPAAQTHLYVGGDSVSALTNGAAVRFSGLAAGDYYAVAFIDRNNNGKRQRYETWGYAAQVGIARHDIWNPVAVRVDPELAKVPSATIYMEDTDVNQNDVLDPFDPISILASASGDVTEEDDPEDPTPGPGPVDPEPGDDTDVDGDGLTSSIEISDTYTDPQKWDTDGDHMPDGWEAKFAGTDPLMPDAETCADGDVMAFATVQRVRVMDPDGNVYILLAEGEVATPTIHVGDEVPFTDTCSTYTYTTDYGSGEEIRYVSYAGVGTNLTAEGSFRVASREVVTVALVHAQVFDCFGYNVRTATTANDAPNTKAFTALDKYMVVRYLNAIGAACPSEDAMNRNRRWAECTVKPMDKDMDRDGIADGWELYVSYGPAGCTSAAGVRPNEAPINPWKWEDRGIDVDKDGLDLIGEYDFGVDPSNPWAIDTDKDGIIDRYAYEYLLKGGDPSDDADGDGLSNYAEYLISEIFHYGQKLNPREAYTADGVLDYFRRMGDLYLGEIFTDHDQVDDAWELRYPTAASTGRYDCDVDADGDGWSNFAEAKVGTDPTCVDSVGVDGYTTAEHPVPMIVADVRYNGRDAITGSLVFKAWNADDDATAAMLGVPDAVWTAPGIVTETEKAGDDKDDDSAVSKATSPEKYIGLNPRATYTQYLGPGAVVPSSVWVYFRDLDWRRVTTRNGNKVVLDVGSTGPNWFTVIHDNGAGVLFTTLETSASQIEVGTVDYTTGLVTIHFDNDVFKQYAYAKSVVTTADDEEDDEEEEETVEAELGRLNLADSYVKIAWQRRRVGTGISGTYYLGDPDAVSATDGQRSNGYIREGKNNFIVYVADGNDLSYVPGSPIGFVRDVDVGWYGAKFTVELSETSAITPRVSPWTDASDRSATYDAMLNVALNDRTLTDEQKLVVSNIVQKSVAAADKNVSRVRVVRFGVNGMYGYRIGCKQRVVLDEELYKYGRDYLYEGDFLGNGEYDIDWKYFKDEVNQANVTTAAGNITNVTYLVVLEGGKGNEYWIRDANDSNTVIRALATTIERRFEATQCDTVADSLGIIYSGRPTFTWSKPAEDAWAKRFGSTYTAFRLQILDRDNGNELVYDSGVQRAPAVNAAGKFEWTAPVYAGCVTSLDKVFKASGNWAYRVAMYNAKFQPGTTDRANKWSNLATFSTAVNAAQPMNDNGYSTVAVAVRYTGPSAVLEKGVVYAEAYTTPDFVGDPLARTVVTNNVDSIIDLTANCKLIGLPQDGTYYIRAFIDQDGDQVRDLWESWGAAKAVSVDVKTMTAPQIGLFIEDADTDNDHIPDAYEYAAAGGEGTWESVKDLMDDKIDTEGKLVFSTEIAEGLLKGFAGVSTGLTGANVTLFQNPTFVSTMFQSLFQGGRSLSMDDIREAVNKQISVKENTLKITAFTFDAENGMITMYIDADVQTTTAGATLARFYDISTETVTVQINVYRRDSLAAVDAWKLLDTVTATIGRDDVVVDVPVTGVDKDGFYKVEVVR